MNIRFPIGGLNSARRLGAKWFFAGTLITLMGSSAFAASFGISPTRFEFSLAKRFTNFFTITNNSEQTVRVRVYPKFIEIGDGDKVIEKVGHPHDLSRWMVFNPRLVTVRPGRKRTVRFSVRPPKDLAEGEYRAVVFFEELPGKTASPFREKTQGSLALQLKLLTRLGVSLYGMVGDRRTKIVVGKESKVVGEKLLTVLTPIENEGNFRAQLKIRAALYDEGGKKIHEKENTIILQREQKRNWVFETARPRPGRYLFVAQVTNKGEKVVTVSVPIEVGTP